jgi:hypothetical protein
MNQALYAHMNNKRKMKKKKDVSYHTQIKSSTSEHSFSFFVVLQVEPIFKSYMDQLITH